MKQTCTIDAFNQKDIEQRLDNRKAISDLSDALLELIDAKAELALAQMDAAHWRRVAALKATYPDFI